MMKKLLKNFLLALAGTLTLSASVVHAATADTEPGSAKSAQLRAKYEASAEALRNNPYKRPMVIESNEGQNALQGDVYAVLPHAFGAVSEALTQAGPWCDIMILPVNTKGCRVTGGGERAGVSLRIGRKFDQPIKDAYPLEFAYRVIDKSADYFAVRLDAGSGPLSTRDYRVVVEATPIEGNKTFLHLHYSYGFGVAGRIAMQAYLATAGASKVGFSSSGGNLVGGMRGVVERNTMRYYLAIESYLRSPGASGLDRRLEAWFDGTEQYARQLHEIDRGTYIAMKRREVERQQTAFEGSGNANVAGSSGRL